MSSTTSTCNRSEAIRSDILNILSSSDSPLKKKKIISKAIKLSDIDDITKKEVKTALKALVSDGNVKEIEQEGGMKVYVTPSTDRQSSGTSDASDSDQSTGRSEDDEPLPFAEVLRRRRKREEEIRVNNKMEEKDEEEAEDIDDEIRRLEAELAADSDEESGSFQSNEESNYSGSDEEDGAGSNREVISFGPATEYSGDEEQEPAPQPSIEEGIIRSELVEERIAPLPKSALPQMKKRKLKGIDDDVGDAHDKSNGKKKKPAINDGLRDAVKEVLGGYVARSQERIPFYCRVCSVQSKDMKSFLAHKETDFHKAADQAERKATYCQACRKQFTSPVQMEEHLESKPHHERMVYLRSRNQGGGRGGGRSGREGGHGYSGRGRGENGGARRQWC